MSSEEVLEKVKGIIVEQLGVAENAVTMEASFIDDLGADSLDIVDLLMDMEEKYGIEFENKEMSSLVTVSDVIKAVELKTK